MSYSEPNDEMGVDPVDLPDADLLRELRSLHRTRLDTLRHGADSALDNHLRRTAELETEYLARHPGREIDPHRLRGGDEAAGAFDGTATIEEVTVEEVWTAGPEDRVGPWDQRPSHHA